MKLTKSQLKRIIKEELSKVLSLESEIDKLMKSKLFRHASGHHRAAAEEIISNVMTKVLTGKEDFYEEIVTDPFDRVAEPNAETLALAAKVTPVSWLEDLSAWSFRVHDEARQSEEPEYDDWLEEGA